MSSAVEFQAQIQAIESCQLPLCTELKAILMTPRSQVSVKRLPERLVMSGAAEFSRQVRPLMLAKKPHVVFDCSAVRRMDSAGAAVLLECVDEVMKHGGDIKLASVSSEMNVILRTVRMDRIFEIFDTVHQAENSFQEVLLPVSNPNSLFGWLASVCKPWSRCAQLRYLCQLGASLPWRSCFKNLETTLGTLSLPLALTVRLEGD